ncbi:uncharacterized protein PAC_04421 [Phialocephala subalpina]|uniref:Sporulation-specific protein 2 n=1 Tax=Phialocephala subalpina TaxID=576137 RepID=A0A1L7WP42_9HELO|nr:uncharacterized protein PAC_04421 [Phialocephala subalpina]
MLSAARQQSLINSRVNRTVPHKPRCLTRIRISPGLASFLFRSFVKENLTIPPTEVHKRKHPRPTLDIGLSRFQDAIRVVQRQSCYWLLIAPFCVLQRAHYCGSGGSTLTIANQASASAISSCTVFSGKILENLVVENSGSLTALGSDSLRRIDGNFTISNVTLLSTLSFPQLTAVDTISFIALPAVSQFTFTSGLSSVSNVIIENSFLSSLNGINLQNADSVQITNNNRLKTISLPLETAKVGIWIEANGNAANVSLPDLTSAGSITLRNVSGISLPSLSFLSGGLLLQGTYISGFAVDKLSVISDALTMHDNDKLNDTSFQGLLSAGTIDVANNTKLSSISFDKLSRVENVTISGNLTNIDMPELTSVNSTFSLQSIDPTFNCSAFDSDHSRSVIPGNYTCLGTHVQISTSISSPGSTTTPGSGSSSSSTPGSSSSSGLSGGEIGGIVLGVVMALALALGVFFFLRRRKAKKTKIDEAEKTNIGTDGKAEIDSEEVKPKEMTTDGERHEMGENGVVKELPNSGERHELGGEHGVTEFGEDERYELPAETVRPQRIPRKEVSKPGP